VAWSAGFYFAEGSKLKNSIGVSNCYLPLIFKFREFVNSIFNIENSKWNIFIRTRKTLMEKVEEKYRKLFNTSNVKSYFVKKANKDNVEIRINSVPLTIIFHNLLQKSINYVCNDKKLALEFLKGYEVGDGSITVRDNCLHSVNITVKDIFMKNLLKKLFYFLYGKEVNERMTKGVYEIGYCNVNLITEIILDGHFIHHKPQWFKLIKAYANKEYTRSHSRYWSVIREMTLSVLEISKKTNRSHWSVRDALNKDIRLDLVKTQRRKLANGYCCNVYILTEKGKKLIDILRGVIKIG
jgi:hypothetical protein